MKTNKEDAVALFEKKMEIPHDIGARVWSLGAKAWVDDGVFGEKGLRAAAQFLLDSGVIKEIPPSGARLDGRSLPVQWRK